jgi:AcrR family transcriptional regulator
VDYRIPSQPAKISIFFDHLSKTIALPIIPSMKATLTRKQREIQDRQRRILELALPMIVHDGYHGLSMDRIAESLEYSKGTIYQHFSCKEEILMALANEAMQRRLDLFRRAAAFRGNPRERITAVGVACELFFQLHSDHFHVEHAIRLTSIREKASEQRRTFLERCEASCFEIVRGVVSAAVSLGDLVLDDEYRVDHVTFGLWSIAFGGYSIAATSPSLANVGIDDPIKTIRNNCARFLDGVGWKPLTKDMDLLALEQRIARDVFPRELAQLGNRRAP